MLWILLIALALPGHAALCLTASNYLNAVVARRTLRHFLTVPIELLLLTAPIVLIAATAWRRWDLIEYEFWGAGQNVAASYLAMASVVALLFVPRWLHQQLTARPTSLLLSNHTTVLDLKPLVQTQPDRSRLGRAYLGLPGNQSLLLSIHEKTIKIPHLPVALDGFSITHLSDLHFTGRIAKPYFDEVTRQANELHSDMVAITGDLVDSPHCLDWLPDTLGRLHAPHGVYFVLGNHDLRAGAAQVRQILAGCGLIDLSGRWLRSEVRDQGIVLAGNELPWFRPAADMRSCPPKDDRSRDFRILLSHSPDQFTWAQRNDFDLMLAGHTHGGQICFPWIGPILAPSKYGVRYSAGTFYLPPLVMHVSRGISGLQPLRFNCPPELTRLVLRCTTSCSDT